jgi:pimeloyl-ACP methyl ester carboxylesterase
MSFAFLNRRRTWLVASAGLVAFLIIVLAAALWYYSGEIHRGAFVVDRDETEYPLVIAAVGDGNLTLEAASGSKDLDIPGVMGLESVNGYGQLGPILSETAGSVTRPFEPVSGQVTVGDRVRYDRDAFDGDPLEAHGLAFSEVTILGPLGALPAWQIPGDGDTWLVVVHGRTATRDEALRFLASTAGLNMPMLVISYRNDPDLAADPSGEYAYGITEWADLDAAVEHATQSGAERLVLVGLSMGGGIVAHYMDKAEDSGRVVGLVLDAPLINLSSALFLAGRQRGVPAPITFIAARLSTMRYGVDWRALDTRDVLSNTAVPMLIFHGTGDATIPVRQSRNFARDVGSRVTYVEVPEAVHVGSWNIDAAGYERALEDWLTVVVGE